MQNYEIFGQFSECAYTPFEICVTILCFLDLKSIVSYLSTTKNNSHISKTPTIMSLWNTLWNILLEKNLYEENFYTFAFALIPNYVDLPNRKKYKICNRLKLLNNQVLYMDPFALEMDYVPLNVDREGLRIIVKFENMSNNIVATSTNIIQKLIKTKSIWVKCNFKSSDKEILNGDKISETENIYEHKFKTNIPIGLKYLSGLSCLVIKSYENCKLNKYITKLANLTGLKLHDTYHLSSIPKEICNLTNLRALSISDNLIHTIPNEISNLVSLKELDLYNNKICNLPQEFYHLTSLEMLQLSDNYISYLSDDVCKLKNLRIIDICNNKITKFVSTISILTNLERIEMAYNEIENAPEDISILRRLLTVDLSQNKIKNIPHEIKMASETILYIVNNPIELIAFSNTHNQNLRRFNDFH